MREGGVAVLDIGTKEVIALFGDEGIYDSFKIKGMGLAPYSGYSSGEFFDYNDLISAIHKALDSAEEKAGEKIKKVFIGVPAEFVNIVVRNIPINFSKPRKVKQSDISEIIRRAEESILVKNDIIVNYAPIYFLLDDSVKTLSPINEKASSVMCRISANIAKGKFIREVGKAVYEFGIEDISFVSEDVAKGQYLLTKEEKEKDSIIIDSGHLTTTLSMHKGDGVTNFQSISLGSGYIAWDLMEVLKVKKFQAVENLMRSAYLTVDYTDRDRYNLVIGNEPKAVSAKLVNESIVTGVKNIGMRIKNALEQMQITRLNDINIYLTGGGITLIKGGKEVLGNELGKRVEILSPKMPQYNKPYFSTVFSLLNYALKEQSKEKGK